MTEIVFGDLFRNEISNQFQISENEVTQAIRGPDEIKRISLAPGYQLLFYVKQMPAGYHILVTGELKEDQFIVQNTFKIFPDLMKEIDSNDPLVVLEKFANKFGLPIQIGGFEEKYMAGDSFPILPGQNLNIVEIVNPQNHAFIQSMMMRVRNDNQSQFIDVSMAFCIDKDEYQKYLEQNS